MDVCELICIWEIVFIEATAFSNAQFKINSKSYIDVISEGDPTDPD